MSRRNEFWTRERIVAALTRFVAEHGVDGIPNYDAIAKTLGDGKARHERPFPTMWTVRTKFPTLAEAWRAAGVDVPVKQRAPKKPKKSPPRSSAYVSAEAILDEASRSLDARKAATSRNAPLRSVPVAVPSPAGDDVTILRDKVMRLQDQRNIFAGLLARILRGEIDMAEMDALRNGLMVGEAASH